MDLQERIARRQRTSGDGSLIVDRSVLSPAHHLEEPIGRGTVLEQLLDALDPVFDGGLSPDVALEGPGGAGKSATVAPLVRALEERVSPSPSIATSTRGGSNPLRWFPRIDARRATTAFQCYRTLLRQISPKPVPERGIGTDQLRERLRDRLDRPGRWMVVAVDHVDDVRGIGLETIKELFAPVAERTSLVVAGRHVPDDAVDQTVPVPAYREHALIDVLSARASRGLATGAIDHDVVRRTADLAEGDAHDALAILFGAAMLAEHDDADRITAGHVLRSADAVPEDGVSLDAVLSLPENRRTVLSAFVELEGRHTVAEASVAIAARTSLSEGTVKRFCYELADAGVLERRRTTGTGTGRRPSVLVATFPALVFAGLADGVDSALAIEAMDL